MVITLLTDFGDADGYVGAMKGVIAKRAPQVPVIDLAHGLAPGDIVAAGEVLAATAGLFPAESIHVVVVDPGVGTGRRAVALLCDDQLYLAPDNGVLSGVLEQANGRVAAVCIDNPAFWRQPVAATFHGRDIFAPVAAHLALGVPLGSIGSTIDPDSLVRLPPARVAWSGGRVEGEIVRFDRFGNAITSLQRHHLARVNMDQTALRVELAGLDLPLSTTYGDAAEGEPVAVVGSGGRLEISVRGASARERLGLAAGGTVSVRC